MVATYKLTAQQLLSIGYRDKAVRRGIELGVSIRSSGPVPLVKKVRDPIQSRVAMATGAIERKAQYQLATIPTRNV